MKVDIFIPCFVDQLFPETAFNMVKVLEKTSCQVLYNKEQTCCGQPAFNAGYWEEAKDVGYKFIKDFQKERNIVVPAGSCVGYVRNFYGQLFDNTAVHNDMKRIQTNIFEFSEFLVNQLKIDDLGANFNAKVTYHDACGALRECKIKEAPRKLLSNVKGLELVEMNECETCCGFGGTFSVKFEAIAGGMVEQKIENALATGAEYIVSTDLSCLMHIDAYIKANNYPIGVMHIADVLAQGWE